MDLVQILFCLQAHLPFLEPLLPLTIQIEIISWGVAHLTMLINLLNWSEQISVFKIFSDINHPLAIVASAEIQGFEYCFAVYMAREQSIIGIIVLIIIFLISAILCLWIDIEVDQGIAKGRFTTFCLTWNSNSHFHWLLHELLHLIQRVHPVFCQYYFGKTWFILTALISEYKRSLHILILLIDGIVCYLMQWISLE